MFALGIFTFVIWLYLLTMHGGFWKAKLDTLPRCERSQQPETSCQENDIQSWPNVQVIIPARNEESVIADTIESILKQDYPGNLNILLVDDQSSDATCVQALQAAKALDKSERLTIIHAPHLPQGWSGKVWAMQQGFLHTQQSNATTPYLWFTDADIKHGKYALKTLITHAEAKQLTLASFMVKLQNQTLAEKLMIPAFIYFFQMLYPFAWINRPQHPLAGAAGGSMLVRHATLKTLGGLDCIQNALIDDCALGQALKKKGPIWLGLTQESISSRGYQQLGEIWMMIARTAYTQLRYNPLMLIVCVIGLATTFFLPIGLTLFSPSPISLIAGIAWAMMTLSYVPILKLYQQSYLWALLLPVTALIYLGATLDSARRYYLGKGGQWKGRTAANPEL